MITYNELISFLKKQHSYPVSVKKKYVVIIIPNKKYHITIFEDQWDDYTNITGLPYHLFHISSDNEENRCSSYFWVDRSTNRIKNIPHKFFKYNQETYNFYSSTRNPCNYSDIKFLLKKFQKIIKKIDYSK